MFRLAIIGYGKMGKLVEKLAKQQGIEVCALIDPIFNNSINKETLNNADIAVEFSVPEAAISNYKKLFECGINVVTGTTGWYEYLDEVVAECEKWNRGLFYASNFSIGMNITFLLNKQLAKMTRNLENYQVHLSETHHVKKLDKPSGTAITLANGIIENSKQYSHWELDSNTKSKGTIPITAKREGEVIGFHSVEYRSSVDRIQIEHEAFSREGFAIGALEACKYMNHKTGVHTMENLLAF